MLLNITLCISSQPSMYLFLKSISFKLLLKGLEVLIKMFSPFAYITNFSLHDTAQNGHFEVFKLIKLVRYRLLESFRASKIKKNKLFLQQCLKRQSNN